MNRRQTFAPGGESSSIPVPATAPRQANRQSLAPGKVARPSSSQSSQPLASSQQSQQGYHAPATVARGGSTYGSGSVPLGWSGARGDAGNLRSSYAPATAARRTSVYPVANNAAAGGRRQSAYPGGITATPAGAYTRPVAAMKDPRPVKDRNFQKKCRDEIAEFLELRGYPQTLTERTLTNPTTKDFQDMFRFIFGVFDGRPPLSLSAPNKKFEDEVPILLRSAGYPFAADISKSYLQAIGAQHSWPAMLAMLHWFVSHVKIREDAFASHTDVHFDFNALLGPNVFMRPNFRGEVYAEYLNSAYGKYLLDENYDIEPERDRLEEHYNLAAQETKDDIMRNTEETEKLKQEHKAISTSKSSLERYRKDQADLDRDIDNLGAYLKKLEAATANYTRKCEETEQKIEEAEQKEKAAIAERKRLAQVVQDQNLTEVDIHRLTTDRQELDAKLRAAREEKEEKSRKAYNLEIEQSKRYTALEKLVNDYDAQATKLGLIPNPPSEYSHIDFRQEINGAAVNPAAMVPDCTSQIKPAIARLKADTIKARRQEEEELITLEEELRELRSRISTKEAERADVETRVNNQRVELANAQSSLKTYAATAQAELDRLGRQCLALKTENSGGLLAVEQRLQALRNEYEKRLADVEKLRRDNGNAIGQQLEMVVNYKSYMGDKINEIKAEVI